jgi:1-acyl-sn-glycerol-3-phosphate acyltransferase
MAAPELRDDPGWLIRATDGVGRFIYRGFARVRLSGLDDLPAGGPVLITSNHVSNADPPLIAAFLTPALGRRIHWLGKQEALDWPVLGWFFGQNAVIGIERGAADVEAFRSARRVLDEGHVLCVFPEGTRSPSGGLQAGKDGATVLAMRTGATILPVGIAGTRRVWPRGQRMPHPGGTVHMRVGRPYQLDGVASGRDRRAATTAGTERIMREIAALLPPAMRGVYADVQAADQATAGILADRANGDPVP